MEWPAHRHPKQRQAHRLSIALFTYLHRTRVQRIRTDPSTRLFDFGPFPPEILAFSLIGTMLSPCAIGQARAIWVEVAPCFGGDCAETLRRRTGRESGSCRRAAHGRATSTPRNRRPVVEQRQHRCSACHGLTHHLLTSETLCRRDHGAPAAPRGNRERTGASGEEVSGVALRVRRARYRRPLRALRDESAQSV